MESFNSNLNSRVIRASASEAANSGLIPSRVTPITLKSLQLSCLTFSVKGTVSHNKSASLLVIWFKAFSIFVLASRFNEQRAGSGKRPIKGC